MYSLQTKHIWLFVVVLCILGIGAFEVIHEKTSLPTESTVVPEPVVEKATVSPTSEVLGTSVEGRAIKVYAYGTGSKHLLFVGGIHGGYEWNSVFLAYTFMDYLKVHQEVIPKNITIDVIPSANPDAVYKVTGKEGRFALTDVTKDTNILTAARFNANSVDLNRNFDCKWKPESVWRNKKVSGGTSAFSEPESKVIKNFVAKVHPSVAVFWHSQANGVYASQCQAGILPGTLTVMNAYSKASGYPAVKTFDAYETTGAADDWLASINIPAITVELKTHETIEWEKNLAGIQALITYFSK